MNIIRTDWFRKYFSALIIFGHFWWTCIQLFQGWV